MTQCIEFIVVVCDLLIACMIRGNEWAYEHEYPIDSVADGADAIGSGALDYRVVVPERRNEFARLAMSFNHMADRLAEQRKTAAREAEERLSLERELRHREWELRHGDRLATVGRLAAGVAHEMGAPLNVIDARAEQLLVRMDAPPETRRRNLTIIRSQAERITQIVRQLLNLARPYQLNREPIDLSLVINDMVEAVEPEAIERDWLLFSINLRARPAQLFKTTQLDFSLTCFLFPSFHHGFRRMRRIGTDSFDPSHPSKSVVNFGCGSDALRVWRRGCLVAPIG